MRVVIVEDEKYTAKDLERTIQGLDATIEVVSIINSVAEGIDFFQKPPQIDLIFSDIQLGDGLSFDIYEKVNIQSPIIYCTAYDEYALKAFKTLGIDYILKPFSKDSVKKALDKFSLVRGEKKEVAIDQSNLLSLLKQQLTPAPKSILVRQGDKIIPLLVEDIAIFYIEHDNVFAFTFKGKKVLLNQKLNALEKLYSETFFRTSRQYLVSRKAIKEAAHYFNRKLKVSLAVDFPGEILVGKLKTTAFLDWLAHS